MIEMPEIPEEAEAEMIEMPEEETQPEAKENKVEDLADLTQVTRADVLGKADGNTDVDLTDLVSMGDKDLEDIVEVSNADIMGGNDIGQPKRKKRIVRIVRPKYRIAPPTSIRGIGN